MTIDEKFTELTNSTLTCRSHKYQLFLFYPLNIRTVPGSICLQNILNCMWALLCQWLFSKTLRNPSLSLTFSPFPSLPFTSIPLSFAFNGISAARVHRSARTCGLPRARRRRRRYLLTAGALTEVRAARAIGAL